MSLSRRKLVIDAELSPSPLRLLRVELASVTSVFYWLPSSIMTEWVILFMPWNDSASTEREEIIHNSIYYYGVSSGKRSAIEISDDGTQAIMKKWSVEK